jgi:hypothetical protein
VQDLPRHKWSRHGREPNVPQSSELSHASEPDAPITHPEEMKATFNLRVGDKISLQGSARTTPAGIISAGITLSAILAALGFVVWAGRKRP